VVFYSIMPKAEPAVWSGEIDYRLTPRPQGLQPHELGTAEGRTWAEKLKSELPSLTGMREAGMCRTPQPEATVREAEDRLHAAVFHAAAKGFVGE
jgi:hypothetical protein